MKLKLTSICFVMLFMMGLSSNVYAATPIIDVTIYTEEYIQSENAQIESIYANTIEGAVIYDIDVTHSGFTYSSSTIDVRPGTYMEGLQLFVSADTLRIDGQVENVAAYSQNVVISGIVKGDMAIYANSVYIKDTAVIEGDVLIYTPVLEVAGTVRGNLLAKASTSTKITGTVEGQVKLITTALSLQNETLIGDVYVETNTDCTEFAKKYPLATFKPIEVEDNTLDNIQSIIIDGVVIVAVCSLITILGINYRKDIMTKLSQKVRTNIVTLILYGAIIPILSIIILPILIIMIMYHLGIIAWPLLICYAVVLGLSYVLRILIFGFVIASTAIEYANKKDVEENSKGKVKPIILTLLLYIVLYTLTQIPFVSSYANMLMFIVSIGVIVTWFMKPGRLTIKK